MIRARLQAGQAKLMQPSANRILMHLYRKPPFHFRLKVHTSPTNHTVYFWIWTHEHQIKQLRLLQVGQGRRTARGAT